jgi:FixJ family two-component response regulator
MTSRQSVVAIVDDDPLLLESLGDLLESVGYTVLAFSSVKTLIEGDRLLEIDCLITDIGMPEIDGFKLREMANSRRPDLPFIFITGSDEEATQKRVADLDRGQFFRKPFDSQALLAAVSEALLGLR